MDEMHLAALRQVVARARILFDTWIGKDESCPDALLADAELAAALVAYDAAQAAEETVPEAWSCPQCGECRMDNLNWDENGELLTCASCGEVYTIDARPAASAPIPPTEVDVTAEQEQDYLAMVGRSLGLHPDRVSLVWRPAYV